MPVTRSQSNNHHQSERHRDTSPSSPAHARTGSPASTTTAAVQRQPPRQHRRRHSSTPLAPAAAAVGRSRQRRGRRATSSPHVTSQYQQRQMAQQQARERRLRSVLGLFDPDDTALTDPLLPGLQEADGLQAVRVELYNSFRQAIITGALSSSGNNALYNNIIGSVKPSAQNIDTHRRQALRELAECMHHQMDVFTCADGIKKHVVELDVLGNDDPLASQFASGVLLLILERTIRLGMIDNPDVYSRLRTSASDVFIVNKVISFGSEFLRPHVERIRKVLAVINTRQAEHGENLELTRMHNQLAACVRHL